MDLVLPINYTGLSIEEMRSIDGGETIRGTVYQLRNTAQRLFLANGSLASGSTALAFGSSVSGIGIVVFGATSTYYAFAAKQYQNAYNHFDKLHRQKITGYKTMYIHKIIGFVTGVSW